MMPNVTLDQLRELPHAYCEDMQGRIFPLHPLLDDQNNWRMWIPGKENIEELNGRPVESNYFAKHPKSAHDLLLPFLEFLEKRALWPDILPWATAITNDIHNLAASMEKLDVFFEVSQTSGKDVRRMVGTELEYIFLTCRSLFDLLQKIIANLWRRVKIQTPINPQKKELPQSFAQIALYGEQIMPTSDIEKKYQIPQQLAQVYNHNAKFFQWLRDYRNKISHATGEFNFITITEKGLIISLNDAPFNKMSIWSPTNTLPIDLGSVKSVISHIISSTLDAFDDALSFFQKKIIFPADVVPNHRMYIRGTHIKHFIDIKNKISNPW